MKRSLLLLALSLLLWPTPGHSFCGFYVAAGNAKLFNRSSQVVMVRDQDRTVLTMANDFQGEPKEFAIVVPVPTVLEKGQIHVGDQAAIDHLEAFTAPRLVEYFDESPCAMREQAMDRANYGQLKSMAAGAPKPASRGVTILAQYTVGEYDILILSAKESRGLETWLTEHRYRIPAGASRALNAYIKQDMKFFVAKVNLKEQQKLGFQHLRPIQIAYESPKFMLPIRLGMVNANGPQELFVFALTRQGRVEATNYRTVKVPSDVDVPLYVKDQFADFYRAVFDRQVKQQDMSVVFTEYAWDMGWCDPCASPPLSSDELKQLGVFWLDDASGGGSGSAFVTRLHVRYDRAHFPEDLVFQVTSDRTNFQGRYVMRHEWTGTDDCPGAKEYRKTLPERRAKTARNLADLTGWDLGRIRERMALNVEWASPADRTRWWERMWKQ
jgi:hypothetical protein